MWVVMRKMIVIIILIVLIIILLIKLTLVNDHCIVIIGNYNGNSNCHSIFKIKSILMIVLVISLRSSSDSLSNRSQSIQLLPPSVPSQLGRLLTLVSPPGHGAARPPRDVGAHEALRGTAGRRGPGVPLTLAIKVCVMA